MLQLHLHQRLCLLCDANLRYLKEKAIEDSVSRSNPADDMKKIAGPLYVELKKHSICKNGYISKKS